MQRSGLALAVAAAALMWSAEASAATRRAVVIGVQDRALRTEIEVAIGDEKTQAANRVDARRRARLAADSAIALLRSEGYYDYDVEPDIGEGDRPEAQVTIDVGPRSVLAAPVIHWTEAPPPQDVQDAVLKALALKPGAPARAADVVAAEGRVVAITQEKGYADAKAATREVVVDHADQTLHATFNITSGGLVRLGSLQVEGKSKSRTRRPWLQNLVPWKTDEVYTPKALAELERRLLETGVYDSVTVSLAPKTNADGSRPVIVSLADRSRHSFELGAGYSTTEGGDIDLKLSSFNPFGRGDTITYEARYATGVSEIGSKVGVLFSLPHFLRPGQTLTVEPSFFQNVTNAYTETGPRITADLTQRYGKTSFITGGGSVTQSRVDDKELGTINILTFRLLGAFSLDRSDNPLDPRSGYKIDGRVEPTQIEGDEQILYLKAQVEGSYYLPLDTLENTVIAVRGHIGSIVGGNIPSVPASDRFFAGGGGSVRGYAYQTVGPHYADNTPVGGLSLVEGSVELRQRFTPTLGGVLFFDTGSVGGQIQPDFRHTDAAIGVGFRYNLGFAPIRADLAFPLQKPNGAGQQPFQIYLSIGQAF